MLSLFRVQSLFSRFPRQTVQHGQNHLNRYARSAMEAFLLYTRDRLTDAGLFWIGYTLVVLLGLILYAAFW